MATIAVSGLRELQRELRRLKDKELNDQLKKTNEKLAKEIVSRALPNVPVRTGRLKATVKGIGRVSGAVGKAGTPSRVPYAAAIHWGWPRRNIRANPFLVQAADALEQGVADRYLDDLNRVLDNVRGR